MKTVLRSGRSVRRWLNRLAGPFQADRAGLLAVLLAGLLLASAGQYFIGRDLESDLHRLDFLAGPFRGIYAFPQTMALAVVLFAAGGLLFALGARRLAQDADTAAIAGSSPEARRPPLAAAALALISLGLFLYLVINLARGSYEELYPHLFLVSALASAGFWFVMARRYIRWSLRPNWWEVCVVGLIMAAFIAVNIRDLTSWYYSAIGDEYAHFQVAKEIGQGQTWNLFSQAGVYEDHPVASSAYQGMVMKVFGFDQFGWRMASLLAAASVIPLLYLLVRMMFGWRPALLSTALFASSHYLFAYAHLGYNNIFPLFPTVLCLLLFVVGMRKGNTLALFGAGCAAGLGFYVFYSSRAAIVILALYLLTLGRPGLRPKTLIPLTWGFLLFVVPMFAVDRLDVLTHMSEQSAVGYESSIVGEVAQRFRENIPRSMLAFNYNPNTLHFVSGSLLDPVSAVLAIVGLLYCFSRIKHEAYRLLATWFVVGIVATGFFFPVPNVAISRLSYMLPVMAILAGLALHQTLRAAGLVVPRTTIVRTGAQTIVAVAVIGAALSLSIVRFWHETPDRIATTPESVALRAALSDECKDLPQQTLIIGAAPQPLLEPAIRAYDLGEETPKTASFEEIRSSFDLSGAGCVVFMPRQDDTLSDLILRRVRTTLDTHSEEQLWDRSHTRYVLVFRPG